MKVCPLLWSVVPKSLPTTFRGNAFMSEHSLHFHKAFSFYTLQLWDCIMQKSTHSTVQDRAKKFLHVWIFPPSFCPLTEAANAQPISPDATCVTELSRNFFARPCTRCMSWGRAKICALQNILNLQFLLTWNPRIVHWLEELFNSNFQNLCNQLTPGAVARTAAAILTPSHCRNK